MPADSESGAGRVPSPSLPHTWRPFGVRVAVWVFGGLLLAVVVAVWIGFGAETRAKFTLLERATLVLMGLMFFSAYYALVRSRVSVKGAVSFFCLWATAVAGRKSAGAAAMSRAVLSGSLA